MATNASAGVIYTDKVLTAGPLANVTGTGNSAKSQVIALKSAMGANIGVDFHLAVQQFATYATAVFQPLSFSGSSVPEVLHSASGVLKKLAFGANISTVPGSWLSFGGYIGRQHMSNGVLVEGGWAPNATGIVGIRFLTTNAAWDYGWVRLSYTLGTNGLANSITATDWAYDTTGTLTAGEGASSTPEPSTTALAILAAGAAGVAALRRRRRESGQKA
jgi:hypothetical protein